ncbi:MAG TPA: hydrogenase maturation nickel metallochaperone HypA [Armatimonadota bacterium]|nr:hydrogenase maturation nickel metallochaperone HypA [Armatimonadota bacterium]
MHEFAIGEALVSAVLSELAAVQPPPARLTRVRVVVGAMRQVVPEYLEFAYEVLTQETPAAGSALEIRALPITVRCHACHWEGTVELGVFLCGACGAADLAPLTGMELYLDQLEVEHDDPA